MKSFSALTSNRASNRIYITASHQNGNKTQKASSYSNGDLVQCPE